jgi:hypothetical protein
MAGGHPRTLNIVKYVILTNQERPDYKDRTRFKELFFTVISKYQDPKLDVQDGRKIVGAAICSASMCCGRRIMTAPDSTMLSLDDMRKIGYRSYLLNSHSIVNLTPVLTPYQMIRYLLTLEEKKGAILLDTLQSCDDQKAFSGNSLATFHAVFECFYRMLWVVAAWHLDRPDSVFIRILYGTSATYSHVFSNSQVSLHPDNDYITIPSTFMDHVTAKNGLEGTSLFVS